MQNRLHQFYREVAGVIADQNCGFNAGNAVQRGRNFHLLQVSQSVVNAGDVLVDDLFTFLGEGLFDRFLDVTDRFIHRNDIGQLEEADLHYRIDTCAQSGFLGDLQRVNSIYVDLFLDDRFLHVAGERFKYLVSRNFAVQQEGTAFADAGKHVITADVGGVVAGDEVRAGHGVLRLDRGIAETQVGYRDTAGFLGVVNKVRLNIFLGIVADNLDRVLVGTDRTVSAQTPEHAAGGVRGFGDDGFSYRQ